MDTPDCDDLGLTDDQRAVLTGFTGRTVRALAHLREAWCIADHINGPAVEASIRALVLADSRAMRDLRPICARVLTVGFDERIAAEFLACVGLGAER
jgi:hypothetical protein